MGVLSKLRGKQTTALATVQAPSADLIRDDNELWCPEPKEIELEIAPEKLAEYVRAIDDLALDAQTSVIAREKLLHLLKTLNLRTYNHSGVANCMRQCIKYASRTLKLGDDLWWEWINLREYSHPLPPRVIDYVKKISHANAEGYSRNYFRFFISDIVWVTSRTHYNCENTGQRIQQWQIIPMKRKTEICFLRVTANESTPIAESLIIDAWRGPTFSDEEAKI
ncbi:MAG: hypothetical protein HYT62_01675 [Candidatus Yanofskybacteria bacterium]|nr:hypothetical protein [Candidatus Yanofskybacteria bacterium]